MLASYKLTELYRIFADNSTYGKHIDDLFTVAKSYSDLADALMSLHMEALKQGMKEPEESSVVESMGKIYDRLPEEEQEKFCGEMLQKKEFFGNAYKIMMDSFENAIKGAKSDGMTEKDTVKALEE